MTDDEGARVMNSPIDHPAHYGQGPYEVIEIIEHLELGFHLGNTLKYIVRAGKKSPATELEDLRKAAWYLLRYIEFKAGK
jgi:hypothetical protein